MPSNRSPSPLSRPNPNSRNSETNSNIRRSFSGYPFCGRPSALTNPRSFNPITPANSPADHLRRHSLGKEGGNLRVHDEKENEKASRVRSPTKGSKHFMSPTISAASKFTPSPRKKVLAERNEAVGTSVQFSDGQNPLLMEITDSKSEIVWDQAKIYSSLDSKVDQKEVIVEVSSISQVTQNSEITEISDHVDVESSSKPFCSLVISPIIAPLDADPSRPPYDPKTNFLSPRPQFLHYKPNPRIEIILNKEREGEFGEGGGLKLEDSFILSENLSDTDVTGESQSEDSQKESEDSSSAETISEEEGVPNFSEPTPISTPIITLTPELASEAKRSSNQQFLTRAKSISLLLVFLIACVAVSVTDSPITDSSVFKDVSLSKLYDPSEVAAFAKSNLHGFARSFRQWSANSISYVSGLILHFSQVDEFGPIQFVNLTTIPSQEDLLVDGYIGVNLDDEELEERHGKDNWEMWNEGHVEDELTDDKANVDLRAYDNTEEELESAGEIEQEIQAEEGNSVQSHLASQVDAELQIDISVEELKSAGEIEQEIQGNSLQSHLASQVDAELQIGISVEDQPILAPQVAEILAEVELREVKSEQEVSDINPESVAADLASLAKPESTVADTSVELSSEIASSEPLSSPLNRTADIFSPQNMMGVSMLVLSLVAGTGFIFLKQRKSSAPSTVPLPAVTKQVSQNWEAEVDVVAESCPSEMSSFQKSSSYTKRVRRETNEAQSHEKRPRSNYKRESLASSSEYSMGSPSYGSFTTYERIPIKHASGEEEIVTPVRRSSRIRSHVTSS